MPPLKIFKELDAVELSEIIVEGTPIIIGQPFTASADWLNNATFRIRNLSDKPLAHFQITLTLPQLSTRIQIPYLVVGCTTEKKICVKPGEEVDLRIPALQLYEWVKKSVAKNNLELSAIDRATIEFALASFEDGSESSSGCMKSKDPRNACPHPAP